MSLSPTEAAFEGFRLTREQPRAVAWWIGVCFLLRLALDLLMAAFIGKDIAKVSELMDDPFNNMDAIAAMGPQMMLFDIVALPLLLCVSAVIACAVYRATLGRGDPRFGYLRLGRDEGRMVLLYLLLFLVFIGVFLAVSFVGAMLFGVGAGAGPVGGMLAGAAAFVAMAGGLVYVGVRLSLAGPMTFAEQRISLPDAWRLTRGRYWPLLGAYLLSFTLAVVVWMLGVTIFVAIGAAVSGSMGTYMAEVNVQPATVLAALSPQHLLVVACVGVLSALQYAIFLPTLALAYRDSGPRRVLTA